MMDQKERYVRGLQHALRCIDSGEDLGWLERDLARGAVRKALAAAQEAKRESLTDLAHKLSYAAYSWGFEAGKVGQHVDTTSAGNKAQAALNAVLEVITTAGVTPCEHDWSNVDSDGSVWPVADSLCRKCGCRKGTAGVPGTDCAAHGEPGTGKLATPSGPAREPGSAGCDSAVRQIDVGGAPAPVAYVVYAPNGNVRLWSSKQEEARRCAVDNGLTVVPLYTHPFGVSDAAGETFSRNTLMERR